MPDWTKSMRRTFEYYTVNPNTWLDRRRLNQIISSSINFDYTSETVSSASFTTTEPLGETYIRIYLIMVQNGIEERRRLGTFLAQSPSSSFNGKHRNESLDAYSPLIELKEKYPPIGYTLSKGSRISDYVYSLTRDNLRAPVIKSSFSKTLTSNFTANTDDTWLSYISSMLSYAEYKFDLDEMGQIIFSPVQKAEGMIPRWSYSTDNSSILTPEINVNRDIYGIPNVIEVIQKINGETYVTRAINKDPFSPISTVTRGREIVKRITNADFGGVAPTREQVDEYANRMLKNVSTTTYRISYSHAYCPVRIGDCVLINYPAVGINNVKAKVITQSFNCDAAMTVNETAEYSVRLMEG